MISQLLFLGSCDFFAKKAEKETDSPKIAQVGKKFLYLSDLERLQLPQHSKEDSTNLVNGFINNWIRKELLLQKAEKEKEIDHAGIEQKVEALRNQLIIYEFQKIVTEKRHNFEIFEEEILEYYDNNKDNFKLKENIVKGRYIKVSNTMPYIEEVKNWIKNDDDNSKDELKSYCIQFADSYFINDSTWISFNDLTKNSPFKEFGNEKSFLKNTHFSEKTDSSHTYFLVIKDSKFEKETSPIEFYRNQIEKTISNKNKQNFFTRYKEELYQEALKNNDFKIYELSK